MADIGDVTINTFDRKKSVEIMAEHYRGILRHGAVPLTLGDDDCVAWQILRAMKERTGPCTC